MKANDTFLFCKHEFDRLEEMLQAAVSRKEWQKAHNLQTEQSAYAAVMEHCFKNEFPYATSVYCTQESKPTWEPDWNEAPKWAKRLLIDDDGTAWWSDGKLDYLDDGCWTSKRWVRAGIIKNALENCYERPQDDIDWSMVPDDYNYVVFTHYKPYQDKSIFCFEHKPEPTKHSWMAAGKWNVVRKSCVSDGYLETPWRDSLRQRP